MKKTMLENHSVEDRGTYLVLHLGDDGLAINPKFKDTVTELCEYLDCLNMLITLTNGQSLCIEQQAEKTTKLEEENAELNKKIANLETCNRETANEAIMYINENTELCEVVNNLRDSNAQLSDESMALMTENHELNEKLAKLGTEKNELLHKMEAYKDANARLGEQVKHLKATVKCLEDSNDFNEECRKMHLNAVKKDLDEAIAEKRVMAVKIDELQIRVSNQESIIKRIRAVAERNAESGFKVARELVELKQQLRDVGDWIETIVNPEDDEE